MNVKARDRRFLARDEPPDDLQLTRSDGNVVYDENGKKYIDFFMGWCVGNMGWGHRRVRKAVRRFTGPEYVSPTFLYKPWTELAELLASLAPGRLTKCYRATGGTESVDIALQVAMAATGRHKFVSLEESYHGHSVSAKSVVSSDYAREHGGLRSQQVPPPLDAQAADKVDTILKKRDVAAFIMEPVVINLGVLVPDKAFMARVGESCRKYKTLFIADEVATGFGRTGRIFASEHFDLEPDIMCMGKAISGGNGGLGATIVTEKVARDAQEGFWSTYGWHPVATEAAIANLKYMRRHKNAILKNVIETGNYFRARLARMKFKGDAQVHAKGLALAVEVEDETYATRIQQKCRRAGVLISTDAEYVQLFPALTIDRETAKKGLDRLEGCL